MNTLKILGHYWLKDTVPGSSPIQTIWKWTKIITTHFHSHFNYGLKKNVATTHVHTLVLAQCLIKRTKSTYWRRHHLWRNRWMWQTVSMCDLPSFSIYFCANKNVFIYQATEAPFHGKDLVDGLNARDKKHLKRYTKCINQPHEGN